MMQLNSFLQKTTIVFFCLFFSTFSWAQTRYVTDQLEITMRSGPSTSNSIISMLKSGESVNVIEQDNDTKYSLVETSRGKQGYVLTRFLDREASGRERFARLQEQTEKLKTEIARLKQELAEYKTLNDNNSSEIAQLRSTLAATENELGDLKTATRDTMAIMQQNDTLKTRIEELETEKMKLSEENTH